MSFLNCMGQLLTKTCHNRSRLWLYISVGTYPCGQHRSAVITGEKYAALFWAWHKLKQSGSTPQINDTDSNINMIFQLHTMATCLFASHLRQIVIGQMTINKFWQHPPGPTKNLLHKLTYSYYIHISSHQQNLVVCRGVY